ncbi:serine/threonine-protein kinase ULK3, partial [Silurus asotus]
EGVDVTRRGNMASSFAPPRLADFLLTEKLGSGTYATVYKAYRK